MEAHYLYIKTITFLPGAESQKPGTESVVVDMGKKMLLAS